MRFRLLGGIHASNAVRSVDLGHARQRSVLAALLLDANRVVTVDQLTGRIWAGATPRQPERVLASYVSRLRRAVLDVAGARILRRSGGYLLQVAAEVIDVHLFRSLVGRARADEDLDTFDEALRLWRGDAFSGIDTPWLRAMRETLHQERRAAMIDRADTALRLGRHTEILPELAVLSRRFPFDERVAGQLMLALYRCDRQADALVHYQQTRQRLVAEVGTEPGEALSTLHARILAADYSLHHRQRAVVEPPVPREVPVPRQLPPAPPWLVGRDQELAALGELVDPRKHDGTSVPIAVLGGVGGIGKSWLALHWAHRNVERFPDGQLYADLAGFTASGEPRSAESVLRGFLEALGVAPEAVPADLGAQAGLYRSLLADRRVLVVLDDARDSAQLTALLPGSAGCAALVTSRNQLSGLRIQGAGLLDLDFLTAEQSCELLARHLGSARVAAEATAVEELLRWCAGLPLAVGIVAARAAVAPTFPLRELVTELRETAARLDSFATHDLGADLRAVFSWSYRALPEQAAEVFRLLGCVALPDFGLPAIASLVGLSTSETQRRVRVLVAAHLLFEATPGRYRLHELVALYAAECAEREVAPEVRAVAARRVVAGYLRTAFTADRLLYPHRSTIPAGEPTRCDAGHPGQHQVPDRDSALVWFEVEHACLVAVQRLAADNGWDEAVWQLAWTMHCFHDRHGRARDSLHVWNLAVEAARRLGREDVRAEVYRHLGPVCAATGDHEKGLDHLRTGIELAERGGDLAAQARSHLALAYLYELGGDDKQALSHAAHARDLYRDNGDALQEANSLNSVGWYLARLGEYERARTRCAEALAIATQNSYLEAEAATLDSLGFICHRLGEHRQAVIHFSEAVAASRSLGHEAMQAHVWHQLGDVHHVLGEHLEARLAWERALALVDAGQAHAEARELRQKLARVAAAG